MSAILIVFDSKTGNVRRFVSKLGMDCLQIEDGLILNQNFILITYTTGMGGQIPDKTSRFLIDNYSYMKGVACSGNKNWGEEAFAKPAKIIAYRYNIPILLQFELSGTPLDIDNFKREVEKLVNNTNS